MYQKVLLVRHAMPIVDPDLPPRVWPLGPEGVTQARGLVERIRMFDPDLVVTSAEAKAVGTGNEISTALGLDCHSVAGFGEQGGDTVPFIDDPEELRETVRQHFEELDRAVLGTESSGDAARRFKIALDLVNARFPEARVPLIVSHGRIMAAFLGDLTGQDPWNIWRELTFPDLLLVDLDARCFEHLR